MRRKYFYTRPPMVPAKKIPSKSHSKKHRKPAVVKHNGWLILDKPIGLSSTQALGRVKYALGINKRTGKAGHGGTLDPLATGILPIALGEATKTMSYMVDAPKTYEFTVTWGAATNTDDTEGEITQTSDIRPTMEQINNILPKFTGEITQTPPAYAAIKIDGVRAYKRARAGEDVEMPSRQVIIHELELLQHHGDTTDFRVTCTKGTYVRALARDFALQLGTYGHITALRRTAVGIADLENCIALEDIQENPDTVRLLPLHLGLDDIPALEITGSQASQLRQGGSILAFAIAEKIIAGEVEEDELIRAMHQGKMIALGVVAAGKFSPTRVFNH